MSRENKDIRWIQRFHSYTKAFGQLREYVDRKDLNDLEKQGLIKSFEYTYELAWKTLQDLLKEKGYTDITGPKPVILQCFQDGYIRDGEAWMYMHESRNLTSHTYDRDTAEEIVEKIRSEYCDLFKELFTRLEKEKNRS